MVDTLYKMGTSTGMDWGDGSFGLGVATKCVRGNFVGVWAADFTLNSIGWFLLQLKQDLHGTIFIGSADSTGQQDGYLFASTSSLITSIEPCLAADDGFVSTAAQMIYDSYDHTFSGAEDEAVLRNDIIVKTKVSSLTSGLLNVVSLGRGQLYSKVDRMCDTIFIFNIIILTVLLCMGKLQNERLESKIEDAEESQVEDTDPEHPASADPEEEQFNIAELRSQLEISEEETSDLISEYRDIVFLIWPQILTLESSIRASISNSSHSQNLEYSAADTETAVTLQMRALAVEFMHDSRQQLDATTHIKLLMLPHAAYRKMWLWTSSGLHYTAFNAAVIAGVVLEIAAEPSDWNTTALYIIQGLIIFVLGFDVAINAVIEFTSARPVEAGTKLIVDQEVVVNIFLVPMLWLMLFYAAMSDRSYHCNEFTCRLKHYM